MSLRAIATSFTAVNYQGTWDASSNTPTLTSSVGVNGSYYIVSVAGNTNLNGITNWGVGDWAVFNGSVWERLEGGSDGNFVNLTVTGSATAAGFILSSSGIITESTTSRTLGATDNGKIIYCTSASATTITTLTGLGAGFSCTIMQGGAGKVTVAQGATTTLVSYSSLFSTMGQYAVISLIAPVSNTFIAAGNLGV